MAPRRTLGGGRILGSGKDIAPPTTHLQPSRNTGLLSPSESSVSLSSQTSSSPVLTGNEDITSRVAVGGNGSATAAAAGSRLVCPICTEEMTTLLQLNRHIDDNHANLEETEQAEAKTWFKQQMTKARKFQPLALINQKLRGLEVFESNNDVQTLPALPIQPAIDNRIPQNVPPPPEPPTPNPDEVVTRSHWQYPSGHDGCSDPLCGKRLGPANGQINCRHCGKLFCEEHTMYQMRLSRAAQHDPIRGLWCRVCETCYKSREGYNDRNGFEREHIAFFKSVRRKAVDKTFLDSSRLETRLTRLTQILADAPSIEQNQSTGTMLWSSLSGTKSQVRVLEQTVVPWEEDVTVAQCPFCQQPFSQYTLRRHHCRTCGRVVCGDLTTGCSKEVGLDVEKRADKRSEKSRESVPVDIRMCKECQRAIFSRADFEREVNAQPPDQRAFQNLVQFERGIRLLLPRFQRLLLALQDPDQPPSSIQLSDASKTRKRLTDAFTQYDAAARRIRDLPSSSDTQAKLQNAVYQQASNFLHVHMLPLKALPKVLKHASPHGIRPQPNGQGRPQGALAAIKFESTGGSTSTPGSQRASSESSAVITALESEEKELKERLIVLEEQKFFVSEMIANANKRRKFDEVSALSQNIEDLTREIDLIQGQIAQMDFAGAYTTENGIIK